MNNRYSCVNQCDSWGIPEARSTCPDTISFNDMQKLGPIKSGCCTCAYQGTSANGIRKYGYFKPIPLPYVNYKCDEQRSPYDNW